MSADIKAAIEQLEQRVEVKINEQAKLILQGEDLSAAVKANMEAMMADIEGAYKGELKAFQAQIDDLVERGEGDANDQNAPVKTTGQLFVESDGYKKYLAREQKSVRMEVEGVKNTITNSGNNTSTHDQMLGVQGAAFRRLTVAPTIDAAPTASNIVYYSRETVWTNNAAEQAGEGADKAESDLIIVEDNKAVQTIAHTLKASKQALDDSQYLMGFIDRRMRHGVNNRLETQIMMGNGVGQNLSGWDASGNHTVTTGVGAGNSIGLVNRMKTEILSADYEPDYVYMNPIDWAVIETTQRGAGDAAYVAASGAVTYVNGGLTPLLWGLPVVVSNNVPSGTIFVKSFLADLYRDREQAIVEFFEQDEDNVQKNLVTVRAELRGAHCVIAPAAIRKATVASIT